MLWQRSMSPGAKRRLLEHIEKSWVWVRKFERTGDWLEELLCQQLRSLCCMAYDALVEGRSRQAYLLVSQIEQYICRLSLLRIERGRQS